MMNNEKTTQLDLDPALMAEVAAQSGAAQESFFLGDYELLEIIGVGGMGQVFLAEHSQTKQRVAIKMLLPEALQEDEGLLERLRREGEALRRLNHPNIVKMLEILELKGDYALVMEYVESGSLYHLLSEGQQLPISYILKVALELADALARAHHLQIIHRDLKPANILLAADGSPRLTDFGVAALQGEQHLTKTGMIVGSVSYMSPEMLEGQRLDVKADIWAFGVLLHEMLTGKRLFEGEFPANTIYKVMSDPIPPVTDFRQDIPEGLVKLLGQLLQRNPAQRIASMRRVGAELEDIIAHSSTHIRHEIPEVVRQAIESSRFRTPSQALGDSQILMKTATRKPISTATQQQLSGDTDILPKVAGPVLKAPPSGPDWRVMAAGLLALIIAAGALFIALSGGGGEDGPGEAAADQAPVLVEPVAEGEYMVLVAQLEALGTVRPRIDQTITDDLTQVVDLGFPLLKTRIRAYPAVINNREAAQAAALANGADVILWGNYTDDVIEVNLEVVAPDLETPLPLEEVQQIGSARFQLENERDFSLAGPVIGSIFLMNTASSETYPSAIGFLTLDEYGQPFPEVLGLSISARFYTFLDHYFRDPQLALEALTEALRINPRSALIYHWQSTLQQRAGQNEAALQSANTSLRLGGGEWILPNVVLLNDALLKNDYEASINYLSQILQNKPQDWFAYALRGATYYLAGDYEAAQADYEAAIALDPEASLPYVFANITAIRQGDVATSQEYLRIILEEYTDPTVGVRLVRSFTGGTEGAAAFYSFVMSGFANLTLGQYQAALEDTAAALALQQDLPELYLLEGVAYCLAGDFEAAAEAYGQGIELDPDFTVLYLLRADAYNRTNQLALSLQDLAAAQDTPQWPNFEALVNAAMAGEGNALGCESFFALPT
jgi:serine/threonine protein kinase/tetratricopeptide (TPR) repeat protein